MNLKITVKIKKHISTLEINLKKEISALNLFFQNNHCFYWYIVKAMFPDVIYSRKGMKLQGTTAITNELQRNAYYKSPTIFILLHYKNQK